MDHLPLPVDKLAHPTLAVPYVCNDRFSYDDKGFLTYPYRCGVDIWQLCEDDQVGSDRWAPFLQAWLWFGLLGETIGIGSRTHVPQRITSFASFVETSHDGTRFVVTKDLQKSIQAACAKNQAPLFNEFHRARFDACLAETIRVLKEILSTCSCRSRIAESNRFSDLPMLYAVLLSVQILAETLYASRPLLFPSQPLSILQPLDDLRPGSELVDVLLEGSGWCPFEILKLTRDVRVRYYLSYLSPFDVREHGQCSKDECRRSTPDEAYIHPFHSSVDCACSSVSIPDTEIAHIAEDGDTPLLTFSEASEGQRRLEITRFLMNQNASDQSPQFVAVSHVRHIGLGNREAHSLPYCQLSSLQMIANELLGAAANPALFWIDTICLPLKYKVRKRTLRKIHRVYQSAAKVIILDPSLFRRSVGSVQEAIFRIRYSAWKRRLWTLQEGVVAKELYVKFRNRTFRLDELIGQYEQSSQPLLSPRRPLRWINNDWLKSALDSFDHDIKTVPEDANLKTDKHKLRTMLRLGYLASPLFRYFCEDWEIEGSSYVVQALSHVYSSSSLIGNNIDLTREFNTVDLAIERVQRILELLPSTSVVCSA